MLILSKEGVARFSRIEGLETLANGTEVLGVSFSGDVIAPGQINMAFNALIQRTPQGAVAITYLFQDGSMRGPHTLSAGEISGLTTLLRRTAARRPSFRARLLRFAAQLQNTSGPWVVLEYAAAS